MRLRVLISQTSSDLSFRNHSRRFGVKAFSHTALFVTKRPHRRQPNRCFWRSSSPPHKPNAPTIRRTRSAAGRARRGPAGRAGLATQASILRPRSPSWSRRALSPALMLRQSVHPHRQSRRLRPTPHRPTCRPRPAAGTITHRGALTRTAKRPIYQARGTSTRGALQTASRARPAATSALAASACGASDLLPM